MSPCHPCTFFALPHPTGFGVRLSFCVAAPKSLAVSPRCPSPECVCTVGMCTVPRSKGGGLQRCPSTDTWNENNEIESFPDPTAAELRALAFCTALLALFPSPFFAFPCVLLCSEVFLIFPAFFPHLL
eukprot:RCo007102